jgi:hypothetical protein
MWWFEDYEHFFIEQTVIKKKNTENIFLLNIEHICRKLSLIFFCWCCQTSFILILYSAFTVCSHFIHG